MRNHLCIIALYLLAVVSCTPDLGVGTPFVEGQEVTLTASIADNPSGAKQVPGKQRVSGKDIGTAIDLTWNAGDEILVSVGDKSAVFTLSSGENSSLGTFTGKMPADGNEYSVSYPVDYSDNVLTHQTYVENGFGNGLMKMSTRTNGTLEGGFVLSADNAVLGLQLSGNAVINKIVLTNLATQATYTLDCSKQEVSTAGGKLFYIVVPAGTWINGMRVEIYNAEGIIIESKEKTSSIEFVASNAMMMPELEMHDIIYKDIEVNGVTFRMILVEGGTFTMGATAEQGSDADSNEKPVHEVTLSDYYIGETEVTQELWEAVTDDNPSDFYGTNLPVELVTWEDCQTFINKLNELTGENFRLPTEAEWEYAARGGKRSKGYKYAGSNTLSNVAWYGANSNIKTHPVKQKQPNELRLYDMSGNVYEWCHDLWGDYSSSTQTNPTGPANGDYHVCRGGNYQINDARYCRVSFRCGTALACTIPGLGLRLTLKVD